MEALLKLLRNDPSPYVKCEAALSLAKSSGADAIGPLMDAMKVPSPNETLAEACLEAIGKFDGAEVRKIIQECLPYGNPTRVRIGAMKAIKARGRILDDEVQLLKDILLTDREFSVRDYIVAKLVPDLGERRMMDALEQASRTDRDHRVRRSALATYHSVSDDMKTAEAISRLKEEVDELKKSAGRA